MRILFLTSRLPYPPLRGDKVRTYNFLRALAGHHEVDLISFVQGAEELSYVSELRPMCNVKTVCLSRARSFANMLRGVVSAVPFQVLYYRCAAMRQAVGEAVCSGLYDLAYVHLFRMAPFVPRSEATPEPGARRMRRVLDLTDAISAELRLSVPHRPILLRPAYRWESRRVESCERRVGALFDEMWTIAEADRQRILGLAPDAHVAVVPNGVDESLFSLAPGGCDGKTVLFVGNLSIAHNTDAVGFFADEIMPLVLADEPRAVGRIVGHSVTPRVERLDGRSGFEVAGHVPDLAEAYGKGAVFVAPLRFAAGVQNKILEAMAAGLPVVTTSLGNAGLGATDGEELFVRDDPCGFAEAVVSLLRSGELRRQIGRHGRDYVRSRFSWDMARVRMEELVSGKV